jgi:hypothetical protein
MFRSFTGDGWQFDGSRVGGVDDWVEVVISTEVKTVRSQECIHLRWMNVVKKVVDGNNATFGFVHVVRRDDIYVSREYRCWLR